MRYGLSFAAAALITTLSAQQAPDRTHPPASGPPPVLHLPSIQKRQLSNGLPVWIVAVGLLFYQLTCSRKSRREAATPSP